MVKPVAKILQTNIAVAPAIDLKNRKIEIIDQLTIVADSLQFTLYDNGEVDGDTVTVYYDGRLIVNKQRLSEKPIEVTLTVDENEEGHRLVLFADNLGSIPPNTALIVVTAGKKRFELRSDADMNKNAVMVIKYERE